MCPEVSGKDAANPVGQRIRGVCGGDGNGIAPRWSTDGNHETTAVAAARSLLDRHSCGEAPVDTLGHADRTGIDLHRLRGSPHPTSRSHPLRTDEQDNTAHRRGELERSVIAARVQID